MACVEQLVVVWSQPRFPSSSSCCIVPKGRVHKTLPQVRPPPPRPQRVAFVPPFVPVVPSVSALRRLPSFFRYLSVGVLECRRVGVCEWALRAAVGPTPVRNT